MAGRPPLKASERRDKRFSVLANAEDLKAIDEAAKARLVSRSTYVLQAALDRAREELGTSSES